MRLSLFIILMFVNLQAKDIDSFITEKEYAEHLYENPRGIGCNKCHGKRGEGMVISRYMHKGEKRILQTQEINTLDYKSFALALQSKRSVMPKYFLTPKEIKALYDYLHIQTK